MEHLSKNQVKWVRSLQQKKQRDAEGVFVAEGHKCVEELRNAFELVLLVTPDIATEVEIAQMSNLRTPQGVIGVFRKPISNTQYSISDNQYPILIYLFRVIGFWIVLHDTCFASCPTICHIPQTNQGEC